MNDKLLLPASEASQLLSISERHFWTLVRRGELPRPINVGQRALWRRKELERWVADRPIALA